MDLSLAFILFGVFTATIAFAGTKLTRIADQLADLTGMGEAIFGAVFLGVITSLSGVVTSITAAIQHHPELAVSNAVGGIAAQTLFLAIADIAYPKVNLEHASASLTNLLQGALLIIFLTFILLVIFSPEISLFGVNPASALMILIYITGTRLVARARREPMWKPQNTRETIEDVADEENIERLKAGPLWIKFSVLALVVAFSGYMVAESGIAIASYTGISEGFVGSLFTAVSTSTPELIVSITAVRQRSLTMAVANIIGGNTFDILFIAFADFAYLKGSIFHAIGKSQVFIIALTQIMTAVLLLGLLYREKKGIAKIGWESFLVLILFVAGYAILYIME